MLWLSIGAVLVALIWFSDRQSARAHEVKILTGEFITKAARKEASNDE